MKKGDLKVGQEYALCRDLDKYGRPAWSHSTVRRVKLVELAAEHNVVVSRYSQEPAAHRIKPGTYKRYVEGSARLAAEYEYTLLDPKIKYLDPSPYGDQPKKGSLAYVGNNKHFIMTWAEWEAEQEAGKQQEARWASEAEEAKQGRIALDKRLKGLGLLNEDAEGHFGESHYEYTEYKDGSSRFQYPYGLRTLLDLADAVEALMGIANLADDGSGVQEIAHRALDSIRDPRKGADEDDD